MNRRHAMTTLTKALAAVGLVAGISLGAPAEASAQQVVVVYPDDAYIASAEPVYYNGVAHYWYRDRWYYRTGGQWAWYREGEPRWLHEYRYRVWPGGVYHPHYHYHAWRR
jgi:hypothetical protein